MAKKKATPKARSKSKSKTTTPLRITDTTLRDAHQSLWATRMRSQDILDIIDTIDSVGYYSLEVWGGATFDVCMRFLRENPWERLRLIKERAKKTPLQMLLRGQNILGYKNYPDDLLDRFVALACENGVDIFRIFDALNDTRNLEFAIKSVKKYGGHAQGTISYTISPLHTVAEYVRIAKEQVTLGIDSLCIKDMAGILSPVDADELISALSKAIKVPIQLHSHATSGMATATYVQAVKSGAGAIDCAISPLAGFNAQPPVETILSIFKETEHNPNLDVDALRKICKYFLELAPKRQLSHHPANIIDPEVLIHHIPGGMISNLRSQLEQQGALDKLEDVMKELPKVREDMGYPPLVTPTSQIVGIQAVMNVLSGERYSMIPQEIKDYVKGLYGKSPAPIKPAVKKKILGKEKTITRRPADLLDPMLPQATKDVEPSYIKGEEDIISYCLFPEVALEYFKWRNSPEDKRDPIPADTERSKSAEEVVVQDKHSSAAQPFLRPEDYDGLHELVEKITELDINEIIIRKDEHSISLESSGIEAKAGATKKKKASASKTKKPAAKKKEEHSGPTIDAPLNGTFYTSPGPNQDPFAKEGDTVKKGDPVCIVEAMKLFNPINAPSNCKIVKILLNHGDAVEKGQAVIAIEEL